MSEPDIAVAARPPAPEPAGRAGIDWLAWLGPYLGLALVVALFSYLTWQRGQLDNFLSLDNLRMIVVHSSIGAAVAIDGHEPIVVADGVVSGIAGRTQQGPQVDLVLARMEIGQGARRPRLLREGEDIRLVAAAQESDPGDMWILAAGLARAIPLLQCPLNLCDGHIHDICLLS